MGFNQLEALEAFARIQLSEWAAAETDCDQECVALCGGGTVSETCFTVGYELFMKKSNYSYSLCTPSLENPVLADGRR